jgi:hypothetical protein
MRSAKHFEDILLDELFQFGNLKTSPPDPLSMKWRGGSRKRGEVIGVPIWALNDEVVTLAYAIFFS